MTDVPRFDVNAIIRRIMVEQCELTVERQKIELLRYFERKSRR